MAVVSVRNLWRNFGSVAALCGISFDIEAGQIVGLLGPNGAGKSTTMKILTGFLAPTRGTAEVAGADVLADPVEVRRQLGYLPENAPVYPTMSVRAYLEFVGQVRGLARAERARGIERVVAECGLEDRMGQRIGTLSRGYRQRVGLAQALLHGPRLLILDEPTAGLDPNQIVEVRDLIRHLGKTRTVVLSTHILPEVQATCDRLIVIHRGLIVADGATEAIVASTSGHTVTVGLGSGKVVAPPAEIEVQLRALPGVNRVRSLAPVDESMRFAVDSGRDLREDVFRWAVEHGHVLRELSGERTNLEEVFRRLTLAEDRAAPAEASP
jgi:ABC-2 type transport system ATP-binding protein